MADPLTIGLIGAGAVGALKGIFGGNDAPSYRDVNLQRDNPDLYNELQRLNAITQEYDRLYKQRSQGPTAAERAQLYEGRSRLAEQQATRGLVGSSAGARQLSEYDRQALDALKERAFREQQQLLASRAQASNNYVNNYQNAQSAVLGAQNNQFQSNRQNEDAQNNFFGGLLNSGLGQLGTQQYLDKVYGSSGRAPSAYSAGIPSFNYQALNQQQNPSYSFGSPYIDSRYQG